VVNLGNDAFENYIGLRSIYLAGNPPSAGEETFAGTITRVYYLPGFAGWGGTFATRPTVLWNPLIQTAGISNGQFGFNITAGTNVYTVVVEACTNLASPVWTPIQTATLTNGSFYFSDPQWTNYPARYYGLGLP
jgi:hypothetical protein